jgi:hypothetical protein
VSAAPTLLEVVGGFSDAVDDHIRRTAGRTDLGEMAQMGAAELSPAVPLIISIGFSDATCRK